MATIGLCKACRQVVSDEATTCVHCGQPSPYQAPPAVGSVHQVNVYSVHATGIHDNIWQVGVFVRNYYATIPVRGPSDYVVGQSVRVRVTTAKDCSITAEIV
jgi:hypothetical protein